MHKADKDDKNNICHPHRTISLEQRETMYPVIEQSMMTLLMMNKESTRMR